MGGEFAHQFGDYDGGRDRSGYGGYIFGSRKFADMKLKPEFELRFVYLSGDDPDAMPDYWTNLQLYMAKVSMELTPDTKLSLVSVS